VKIIAFQLSLFKDCPLKKIHWCLKIPDLFLSNMNYELIFMQDDSFATEDLWDFLSDVDFSALGKRPSTWEESVLGLRDEMANDVVIRCAASLFSLNIHIIDWIGVSTVPVL
jgi:hypothetical protein